MYTQVSLSDTEVRYEQRQVSSIHETAETIRDSALSQARSKMLPREQNTALDELLYRRDFFEYFKYSLAQEAAQTLASKDQHIQSVYIFEESTNPDAETEDYLFSTDLTVHLLAVVTSATAALEAFITSLDRALTEALRELPSGQFSRLTSYLDVLPVTESDVEQGQGYAKLLSSIYSRPLKIWQRD